MCTFCIQWKGSCGLQECIGTSSQQALENQAIRTEIANHPDVVKLFHTYKLENSSTVELERNLAWNHVRHCLGEIKKTAKKRGVKVCNYGVHVFLLRANALNCQRISG